MIEYSDQEFEKKLMLLKDTQGAIQSLSAWCLKRHENHKKIISTWLNVIRKVKIEKRLTLFYLANDVIQYSKKKNYKFVDGWATAIQKAIPYVRDEKIQSKISRIIKIWEERVVYDDSYLADLTGLLTKPIQKLKLADPVQEFQIHALAVKIRSCVKLEQITDLKMKTLREANLPLTNNKAIQNMLKDRTRSHEFLNELNDGMAKIESYIKCLKRETVDRAQLIDALEVATSYYEEQNGEVKTVAQAYFNYTKRVKLLKSKLVIKLSLTSKSSTTSNQGLIISNYCNSGSEPTMSLAEFQKYVVNTLSVMKYDINCCVSTNQQINANINTLLDNLNKNAVTSDDGFNDYDINDIFPIESHEALREFELKLQKNENNFKAIMVRKLSLLVTNKSVGDSVRRVLSRMFDDKVLESYSTYGFKKKLRFSSLYTYQLLFDVLRTNIKYKTVPEKDIDNDIGTWLAHAHFRRVKKINKSI